MLLVEGKNDEHVFYSLLKHHNIPERFTIKNKEGIQNILDTLSVELKTEAVDRIGIVVDADTNLTARWQALQNILIEAGYSNAPKQPAPEGTIIVRQDKAPIVSVVGIWVMPNNTLPGILEDFVSFLIPYDDALWNKAKECVKQIPEQEQRFSDLAQSKAYIHTWLAWQNEPDRPLGQAITNRYLDADAPNAKKLVDWICRLFDIAPS